MTRVWDELQIKSIRVKNRIARSACTTTLFQHSIDDAFIAHHLARARGGLGLTVLEAGAVHPNSVLSYLVDDAIMPGFERLMKAVRPHDMRVFQQLWHGGHAVPVRVGIPWGPSATPSASTGVISQPMGAREIEEVVQAFGIAAKRCKDAGLDGVEVHGAHGYLIQQFLSPLTNLREDAYNGDLEARSRFLVEVMQSIRASVGQDYPIGVRLGSSTAVGGTTVDDLIWVATHLEKLDLIDFLDLTFGDPFEPAVRLATMALPTGYEVPLNEPVCRAVKVPCMVTGRIRTVEEAQQILSEGFADLISMNRAHIADPNIVKKTLAGKAEEVRPCIACNQGCLGMLGQAMRMQCTVNAAAGNELQFDEALIEKVAEPKKVMIIGGGPAGLEAARICALRGHQVVLAEAGSKLGGTVLTAARAPYLAIFGDLIDWLERQVYALGIDVRMSTYVEAEDVLAESPDVVILATGSLPDPTGRQALIPGELPLGADLNHVYDPSGLLDADIGSFSGKSALVFDDVGRYEAIAAAEHLLRAGADVTFVTSQLAFAAKMKGTGRDLEAITRLNRGSFKLILAHNLTNITPHSCHLKPSGVNKHVELSAEIVVIVNDRLPLQDLYETLRDSIPEVLLIGDALSPRDMLNAISDGHRCARGL